MNQVRKKATLSVCAIMKNEGLYLREWLEFHKLVGVERFYLYNNNSTDRTLDIVRPYRENHEVVLTNWSVQNGQQMKAYNHFLQKYKNESKWIAFIDLDEFLFPTEKNDLREILEEFPDVPAIGVNWLIFGTSGYEKKPKGLQIENFTKRAKEDFQANLNFKCIVRSEFTIECMTPHHFVYVNDGVAVSENYEKLSAKVSPQHSVKKLRINHYFTRSMEESLNKIKRGRATVNHKRKIGELKYHDRNEVEDLTIQRYIPKLKKSLAVFEREKDGVTTLEESNSLLTIGNLGKVVLENQILQLTGWIVSLILIPVSGFKVWIGGEEYKDFKQTLGIKSPRIKKARPRLKGAEKARFCLEIPLNKIHRESYQDLLIILIPMLGNFEGSVLIDVFNPSRKIPSEEYISQIDRNSSVDFQSNAFKWLGYLIQRTGLKPTDSILDIGCGIGEIAYGLTYYLTPKARYEGIEFSEKAIDWAQQEITPRKSNFNFQYQDIFHPIYNSKGTIPMKKLIFPYAEASFDAICISNLFTHLSSIDMRHYFQQIQRVIKVGGKCLFACFLINSESQQLMTDGKSSQHLVYEIEGGFCLDPELPEKTIGFQESLIIDWIKESGLTVVGKYYGSWCGRKSFTHQDLLILQKKN
ncbi:glycosyltransferase family 92 protein [Okeania sp. SIO2B3]|uniref:glycosyltransferase family 92 protein n=1 Tax=Okeania sp. SIO2B3 TaxID=2607784 RepID=UPI0013C00BE9|nr:glycosyltransferase family 92 protein [Okeania sp. SIO2B3]NET42659.1 glycosyltransferase family 92 protein [Okeania sp. SIO2B3]